MAGPWEKYQKQATPPALQVPSGPWSKYAKASASTDTSSGPQPSLLEKVGQGIGYGLERLASVTEAPTRAAIYAAQEGRPVWDAFKQQFGAPANTAPSGQQIAQKLGVSDQPLVEFSPEQIQAMTDSEDPLTQQSAGLAQLLQTPRSAAAGVGIEMAANPLNLAPAVGSGLKAAGGLTERLGENLLTKAAKQATAALAKPNLAQLQKLVKTKQEIPLGQWALENDVIKPWLTPQAMADRAGGIAEKAGQNVERLITGSQAATIQPKQIARQIQIGDSYPELRMGAELGLPKEKAGLATMDPLIDALINKPGPMTPAQAWAEQKLIGGNVPYSKPGEFNPAQEALSEARTIYGKNIQEAVRDPLLKESNLDYFRGTTAKDLAQKRADRLKNNLGFGLTDLLSAGAGATQGHSGEERLQNAILFGGGSRIARTFGPQFSAWANMKLGQAMKKAPELGEFLSRNPQMIPIFAEQSPWFQPTPEEKQ